MPAKPCAAPHAEWGGLDPFWGPAGGSGRLQTPAGELLGVPCAGGTSVPLVMLVLPSSGSAADAAHTVSAVPAAPKEIPIRVGQQQKEAFC